MIKQLKGGCIVSGELQNIAHLEIENIIGLYLKCLCVNINAIYSDQYHTKCGRNRECKISDVSTRCVGASIIISLEKNAVDFSVEISYIN